MKATCGFSSILIVLIFALLAGGAYVYLQHDDALSLDGNDSIASTTTTQANNSDEFVSWQTYTDSKYGFSFKYPSNWKIIDNIQAHGAPVPVVSVAPNEFVWKDGTDTPYGYFYVYAIVDTGESQATPDTRKRLANGWFDTGWSEPGMYIVRQLDTQDQRVRIIMIGGRELEPINEKILRTFEYRP